MMKASLTRALLLRTLTAQDTGTDATPTTHDFSNAPTGTDDVIITPSPTDDAFGAGETPGEGMQFDSSGFVWPSAYAASPTEDFGGEATPTADDGSGEGFDAAAVPTDDATAPEDGTSNSDAATDDSSTPTDAAEDGTTDPDATTDDDDSSDAETTTSSPVIFANATVSLGGVSTPEVTLGADGESGNSSSAAGIYDLGTDDWAGVDTGNCDGQDYGGDVGLIGPGGCPIYCLPYGTDPNEGPEYTDTPYPYSSDLPYETDPTYEPGYTPTPYPESGYTPTPVSSFSTSSGAYTIYQSRQATPTAAGGFAAFQWPSGGDSDDEADTSDSCDADTPSWLYDSAGGSPPPCRPACPASRLTASPTSSSGMSMSMNMTRTMSSTGRVTSTPIGGYGNYTTTPVV